MTKTSVSIQIAVSAALAAAAFPSLANQEDTGALLKEDVSPALLRSIGHLTTGRMADRLGADRSGVDGSSLYGGLSHADVDGAPHGKGIEYEGSVTSLNAGFDVLLSYDGVAGLLVSSDRSEVTFAVDGGGTSPEGSYDIDLNAIHAYISWGDDDKWRVWAKAGGGSGDASASYSFDNEIRDGNNFRVVKVDANNTYDASLMSYAGGFRYDLTEFSGVPAPGALVVDGFASYNEIDIDGTEVQGNAAKLGGSYILQQEMAARSVLDLYLSAAGYAGWTENDDRVGYEVVLGTDYRYQDRTVMGAKLRFLELPKRHKEVGIAANFVADFRSGGLGFGARLEPSYGGSLASEWGQDELSGIAASAARLDAEIGYGLAVDGGVLKPYGGYVIDQGASYGLGVKLEQGGEDRWQLGYKAGAQDEADNGYSLTYRFM